MSTDGKRRRDYLPGLSENERQQGLLLRRLSQSAAEPASGLHDGSHALATGSGPHRNRLRMVFRSGRTRQAGFHRQPTPSSSGTVTNRQDWHIVELSQWVFNRALILPALIPAAKNCWHAFDQVVIQRDGRLPE